jgi:hypothetical protein
MLSETSDSVSNNFSSYCCTPAERSNRTAPRELVKIFLDIRCGASYI